MLLVAFLGVAVYTNTMDGEFVWDDVSSVLLHKHVQDPATMGQLFRENQHAFSGREGGRFYRPLVSLSFMADFAMAYEPDTQAPTTTHPYPDVDPFLFHVTNLAWHVLASVLLLLLLVSLRVHPGLALGVVAIYVVHPLHTEAVAYISGRADMMSASFLFAGLLATALRGTVLRMTEAAVLCGLFFLGGLFSKESAAIFPLLLVLVIWLRARQDANRPTEWRGYLPHFVPLIGALVGGVVYFIVRSGADLAEAQTTDAAGLGTRLMEVGQSLALYAKVLFWPTGLHMERTLAGVSPALAVLGYAFLAAMVVAIVWGLRTGRPQIAVALCWFIITWLPISGLFPLNAPMAEHWLYVPMAGFWWGLALLLASMNESVVWHKTLAAAAAVLVLMLGLTTIARNEAWQSNTRLYEATLAENPETSRVQYNLAVTYENLTGNTAGARRHFQRAAELGAATESPDVMLSLGNTLFSLGRYSEAYTWFIRLAGAPGSAATAYKPAAITGIGRCYLALGYFNPASAAFQQALQLDPQRAAQVQAWEAGAPL